MEDKLFDDFLRKRNGLEYPFENNFLIVPVCRKICLSSVYFHFHAISGTEKKILKNRGLRRNQIEFHGI